jgi:phytoene desaturase
MSSVGVIGAGFSGLSAACYLSAAGHEVHVYEKNAGPGGRARQLRTDDGFTFDMGPSWYWMPGVFERFFSDFGCKVTDLYNLQLLNPSFEIVFGKDDSIKVPAGINELYELFESVEEGSSKQLKKFLVEAEQKYRLGMEHVVYKPSLSLSEFFSAQIIAKGLQSDIFTPFNKHVRKFFSNPKLIALMEFPVLFLGGKPSEVPALYSLMNYAGLKLGNWYPEGGFGKVIDVMKSIAERNKVAFHFNSKVEKLNVDRNRIASICVNGREIFCDGVVASADYHHIEQLLVAEQRNYSEKYWNSRTLAPSSLIFYLGINKKLPRLHHHTLFFDENLEQHTNEIYKHQLWPSKPLFYACCPSKSDTTVAPPGHENIFLLMPIAAGLSDSEQTREKYFSVLIQRLEAFALESIEPHIVYKKSYCINDFVNDYHSYKGNAYGLANTLMQTAILKPKIKNNKLKNLFYAGQLTVPGPGVPPSIISGKIAAGLLNKFLKEKNEVAV